MEGSGFVPYGPPLYAEFSMNAKDLYERHFQESDA